MTNEGLGLLFKNFSKLTENKEMNSQGTGLGLSICKQLVQAMGGSIKVKSTVGKGTTFLIELNMLCNPQDNDSDYGS